LIHVTGTRLILSHDGLLHIRCFGPQASLILNPRFVRRIQKRNRNAEGENIHNLDLADHFLYNVKQETFLHIAANTNGGESSGYLCSLVKKQLMLKPLTFCQRLFSPLQQIFEIGKGGDTDQSIVNHLGIKLQNELVTFLKFGGYDE